MKVNRVFLIGFMGSGKSTLGKRLKTEMGWDFLDLDDAFEEKYRTTIKQFFAVHGEEAFRKAERDILSEVVNKKDVIIAAGGGTPCYYDNMELMNTSGLTIYLKLPVDILARRLASGKQVRPLVAHKTGDELHQYIEAKLREREVFYNQSQLVVDAETLGVEAYVTLIRASGDLSRGTTK